MFRTQAHREENCALAGIEGAGSVRIEQVDAIALSGAGVAGPQFGAAGDASVILIPPVQIPGVDVPALRRSAPAGVHCNKGDISGAKQRAIGSGE